MTPTTDIPPDPAAVIESLDPDDLRTRIAELERQRDALRVLLRSALARQRGRRAPIAETGGGHAD